MSNPYFPLRCKRINNETSDIGNFKEHICVPTDLINNTDPCWWQYELQIRNTMASFNYEYIMQGHRPATNFNLSTRLNDWNLSGLKKYFRVICMKCRIDIWVDVISATRMLVTRRSCQHKYLWTSRMDMDYFVQTLWLVLDSINGRWSLN